jgi:hypothetical protein
MKSNMLLLLLLLCYIYIYLIFLIPLPAVVYQLAPHGPLDYGHGVGGGGREEV